MHTQSFLPVGTISILKSGASFLPHLPPPYISPNSAPPPLHHPSPGGQWVGPTHYNFLALLEEYNIPLYLSYHLMSLFSVRWGNYTYMEEPAENCLGDITGSSSSGGGDLRRFKLMQEEGSDARRKLLMQGEEVEGLMEGLQVREA
jgi:hypothetical protein